MSAKLSINELDVSQFEYSLPVFHKTRSSDQPDPSFVYLDLKTGSVEADSHEASTNPTGVANGWILAFPIDETLTAPQINSLLNDHAGQFAAILAGSVVGWSATTNCLTGRLTPAALRLVESFSDGFDVTGNITIEETGEWLSDGIERALCSDGLTLISSDADIAKWVNSMVRQAWSGDRVYLYDDPAAVVAELIAEARSE